MKWHLIATVIIIAAIFSEEILAKPPKYRPNRTKVKVAISKPKNSVTNRYPVSTAVASYKPRTSRFSRIISTESSSHPAPAKSSSSPSTRFARLRLSSTFRPTQNPISSSVPLSGNNAAPTRTGGSRTTFRERWSNLRTKQNQYPAKQPTLANRLTSTSGRTSASGQTVGRRSGSHAPRLSLKQLWASSRNPQSQTVTRGTPPRLPTPVNNQPSSRPSSPVNNPTANRPPSPVNNPIANNPTANRPPSPVHNSEAGPSSSQLPVPAAFIQAEVEAAPGSKADLKAQKQMQKKLEKEQRIARNKAKLLAQEQATLEKVNANAGTCKDPTAPANKCFDFYILAVSWGITMQVRRPSNTNMINKAEWTVHGLWPSLKTYHKVPKQCNLPKPYDLNELLTLQDELEDKWFAVNGAPMSHNDFWKHEWEKHGSCAARSPQTSTVGGYFRKGLELFRQANIQAKLNAAQFNPRTVMTNREMHQTISRILGHTVTLEYLNYPKTNENLLSEIRICYSLDFHIINCPPYERALNAQNADVQLAYSTGVLQKPLSN